MTAIQEIMQVGVGMPDREKFERFARGILGFPSTRSPDGKVTYLQTDQHHHRIAARAAPQPVLDYVGFDVGGSQQLTQWEPKLTALGIEWRSGRPEECAARHVTNFIEIKDPDGHPIALSSGFEINQQPVRYTRDLSVLRLGTCS